MRVARGQVAFRKFIEAQELQPPVSAGSPQVEYSLDCDSRDLLLFGAVPGGTDSVRLTTKADRAVVQPFGAPRGVRINGSPFVIVTRARGPGHLEAVGADGSIVQRLRLSSPADLCDEADIRDPVVIGTL